MPSTSPTWRNGGEVSAVWDGTAHAAVHAHLAERRLPPYATGASLDRCREFPDDESRWHAVLRRDPQADGAFWYSVLTTGTYSRPSCGSRHARRANIVFFGDLMAAEQAGFRPCRRCLPDREPQDPQAAAVVRSCQMMELSGPAPCLSELAEATGLSRFHFHRVFAALMGITPKAYADACRTERLREELVRARTITEAIYQAGFNSSGAFYALARDLLGMTPTAFRNRGRGERVQHIGADSSLGPLVLATTATGICAVLFGPDAPSLLRVLRTRFAAADIGPADPATGRRLLAAVRDADGTPKGRRLPQDIRRQVLAERLRIAGQPLAPAQT
ncbi:Ada metal-binding domain-containing protein [Streptomyces sp. NPDC046985]|uniref:bifunctional transcriptional activator/DNA repair enzyme AdaA n=1 Tax=Streptomyces sp. NPDC046985 TaxID=3155377 RepID=UPI0033F0AADC